MKARLILLPIFLVCAIPLAAAFAQRVPTKTETARFGNPTSIARIYQGFIYGVVRKIDKTELVLDKTVFGDDQIFKLGPKTKFIHDGKPSSLDNLKVGDQVWVDVKKEKKTGEMMAKKVVTGVGATQEP